MLNFVKIARTAAEIWRFCDFSKMAAVCHLGFAVRVWGPPAKGIMVVFITVQDLVGIGSVVLIIRRFFDFLSLA